MDGRQRAREANPDERERVLEEVVVAARAEKDVVHPDGECVPLGLYLVPCGRGNSFVAGIRRATNVARGMSRSDWISWRNRLTSRVQRIAEGLDEDDAWRLFHQVLDALVHISSLGIVSRRFV